MSRQSGNNLNLRGNESSDVESENDLSGQEEFGSDPNYNNDVCNPNELELTGAAVV